MVDGFYSRECVRQFSGCTLLHLSARERKRRPAKRILFPRIGRAIGRKFPSVCPCVSVTLHTISLREKERLFFFGKLSFFGVHNHLEHHVTFFSKFSCFDYFLFIPAILAVIRVLYIYQKGRISSEFRSPLRRRRRRFRARVVGS